MPMTRHPWRQSSTIALLGAILFLVQPNRHAEGAVSFGQQDTFQDGTTMSWSEGVNSPNPPTNIATGGPAGINDRFLRNISNGGAGPGSKMIMFNDAQWTGNYVAAGVNRITAQMANFGSTTLFMRVAFRGGPTSTLYGSSVAAQLPPDGVWRSVTFDLTSSGLTNIGGADTLSQVLSAVAELRILSAVGGASFNGDPVQATLGVDNILARDIANFVFRITDLSLVSGAPQISFTTVSGRTYRVERKDTLTDPNWTGINNGSTVPGTGGVVQVTDNDPDALSSGRKFYRVILLPP